MSGHSFLIRIFCSTLMIFLCTLQLPAQTEEVSKRLMVIRGTKKRVDVVADWLADNGLKTLRQYSFYEEMGRHNNKPWPGVSISSAPDSEAWIPISDLIVQKGSLCYDQVKLLEGYIDVEDIPGSGQSSHVEESEQRVVKAEETRDAAEKQWVVQVAAYPKAEQAQTILQSLRDAGYHTYLSSRSLNKGYFYRVRVGFYSTIREAIQAGEEVKKVFGVSDVWVTVPSESEIASNPQMNMTF